LTSGNVIRRGHLGERGQGGGAKHSGDEHHEGCSAGLTGVARPGGLGHRGHLARQGGRLRAGAGAMPRVVGSNGRGILTK
jgi:hypothetical protein